MIKNQYGGDETYGVILENLQKNVEIIKQQDTSVQDQQQNISDGFNNVFKLLNMNIIEESSDSGLGDDNQTDSEIPEIVDSNQLGDGDEDDKLAALIKLLGGLMTGGGKTGGGITYQIGGQELTGDTKIYDDLINDFKKKLVELMKQYANEIDTTQKDQNRKKGKSLVDFLNETWTTYTSNKLNIFKLGGIDENIVQTSPDLMLPALATQIKKMAQNETILKIDESSLVERLPKTFLDNSNVIDEYFESEWKNKTNDFTNNSKKLTEAFFESIKAKNSNALNNVTINVTEEVVVKENINEQIATNVSQDNSEEEARKLREEEERKLKLIEEEERKLREEEERKRKLIEEEERKRKLIEEEERKRKLIEEEQERERKKTLEEARQKTIEKSKQNDQTRIDEENNDINNNQDERGEELISPDTHTSLVSRKEQTTILDQYQKKITNGFAVKPENNFGPNSDAKKELKQMTVTTNHKANAKKTERETKIKLMERHEELIRSTHEVDFDTLGSGEEKKWREIFFTFYERAKLYFNSKMLVMISMSQFYNKGNDADFKWKSQISPNVIKHLKDIWDHLFITLDESDYNELRIFYESKYKKLAPHWWSCFERIEARDKEYKKNAHNSIMVYSYIWLYHLSIYTGNDQNKNLYEQLDPNKSLIINNAFLTPKILPCIKKLASKIEKSLNVFSAIWSRLYTDEQGGNILGDFKKLNELYVDEIYKYKSVLALLKRRDDWNNSHITMRDKKHHRFNMNLEDENTTVKKPLILTYNDTPLIVNQNSEMVRGKLYTQQYKFYGFDSVFNPEFENNAIATRLTDPTLKFKLKENEEPIVFIGYGQSGSGKTSTLIYLDVFKQDGILIEILKKLGPEKITVGIIELYEGNAANEQDMACVGLQAGAGIDVKRCFPGSASTYKNREKIPDQTDKGYFEGNGALRFITMGEVLDKHYDTEMSVDRNTMDTKYRNDDKEKEKKPVFEKNNNDDSWSYKYGNKDDLYDNYKNQNNDKEPAGGHQNNFDLKYYILNGFNCREIAPTSNNKQSSRSHVIVSLELDFGKGTFLGGKKKNRMIYVCDLAGVENEFDCTAGSVDNVRMKIKTAANKNYSNIIKPGQQEEWTNLKKKRADNMVKYIHSDGMVGQFKTKDDTTEPICWPDGSSNEKGDVNNIRSGFANNLMEMLVTRNKEGRKSIPRDIEDLIKFQSFSDEQKKKVVTMVKDLVDGKGKLNIFQLVNGREGKKNVLVGHLNRIIKIKPEENKEYENEDEEKQDKMKALGISLNETTGKWQQNMERRPITNTPQWTLIAWAEMEYYFRKNGLFKKKFFAEYNAGANVDIYIQGKGTPKSDENTDDQNIKFENVTGNGKYPSVEYVGIKKFKDKYNQSTVGSAYNTLRDYCMSIFSNLEMADCTKPYEESFKKACRIRLKEGRVINNSLETMVDDIKKISKLAMQDKIREKLGNTECIFGDTYDDFDEYNKASNPLMDWYNINKEFKRPFGLILRSMCLLSNENMTTDEKQLDFLKKFKFVMTTVLNETFIFALGSDSSTTPAYTQSGQLVYVNNPPLPPYVNIGQLELAYKNFLFYENDTRDDSPKLEKLAIFLDKFFNTIVKMMHHELYQSYVFKYIPPFSNLSFFQIDFYKLTKEEFITKLKSNEIEKNLLEKIINNLKSVTIVILSLIKKNNNATFIGTIQTTEEVNRISNKIILNKNMNAESVLTSWKKSNSNSNDINNELIKIIMQNRMLSEIDEDTFIYKTTVEMKTKKHYKDDQIIAMKSKKDIEMENIASAVEAAVPLISRYIDIFKLESIWYYITKIKREKIFKQWELEYPVNLTASQIGRGLNYTFKPRRKKDFTPAAWNNDVTRITVKNETPKKYEYHPPQEEHFVTIEKIINFMNKKKIRGPDKKIFTMDDLKSWLTKNVKLDFTKDKYSAIHNILYGVNHGSEESYFGSQGESICGWGEAGDRYPCPIVIKDDGTEHGTHINWRRRFFSGVPDRRHQAFGNDDPNFRGLNWDENWRKWNRAYFGLTKEPKVHGDKGRWNLLTRKGDAAPTKYIPILIFLLNDIACEDFYYAYLRTYKWLQTKDGKSGFKKGHIGRLLHVEHPQSKTQKGRIPTTGPAPYQWTGDRTKCYYPPPKGMVEPAGYQGPCEQTDSFIVSSDLSYRQLAFAETDIEGWFKNMGEMIVKDNLPKFPWALLHIYTDIYSRQYGDIRDGNPLPEAMLWHEPREYREPTKHKTGHFNYPKNFEKLDENIMSREKWQIVKDTEDANRKEKEDQERLLRKQQLKAAEEQRRRENESKKKADEDAKNKRIENFAKENGKTAADLKKILEKKDNKKPPLKRREKALKDAFEKLESDLKWTKRECLTPKPLLDSKKKPVKKAVMINGKRRIQVVKAVLKPMFDQEGKLGQVCFKDEPALKNAQKAFKSKQDRNKKDIARAAEKKNKNAAAKDAWNRMTVPERHKYEKEQMQKKTRKQINKLPSFLKNETPKQMNKRHRNELIKYEKEEAARKKEEVKTQWLEQNPGQDYDKAMKEAAIKKQEEADKEKEDKKKAAEELVKQTCKEVGHTASPSDLIETLTGNDIQHPFRQLSNKQQRKIIEKLQNFYCFESKDTMNDWMDSMEKEFGSSVKVNDYYKHNQITFRRNNITEPKQKKEFIYKQFMSFFDDDRLSYTKKKKEQKEEADKKAKAEAEQKAAADKAKAEEKAKAEKEAREKCSTNGGTFIKITDIIEKLTTVMVLKNREKKLLPQNITNLMGKINGVCFNDGGDYINWINKFVELYKIIYAIDVSLSTKQKDNATEDLKKFIANKEYIKTQEGGKRKKKTRRKKKKVKRKQTRRKK